MVNKTKVTRWHDSDILRARFLEKTRIGNGCWEWLACKNSDGYGMLCIGRMEAPNRGVSERAHRVAYGLFKHAIPDGAAVLHRCDNPGCVNPDHLILGTQHDNIADMVAKRRNRNGSQTIRGEKHPNSKLEANDVRAIRALRGQKPQSEIAAIFGITFQTVSDIQRRRRWKWL